MFWSCWPGEALGCFHVVLTPQAAYKLQSLLRLGGMGSSFMAPLPRFEGPRSLLCVLEWSRGRDTCPVSSGVSGEDSEGALWEELRRAG